MVDRTISVLIDHTASLNNSYLANQGEEITLDVTIPAGLVAPALDGYIDFELPDGSAYFKGPFNCSTGTISTTLGATDTILNVSGDIHWQFVLAVTTGTTRNIKWVSKKYVSSILPSVCAVTPAITPDVPQIVFNEQYLAIYNAEVLRVAAESARSAFYSSYNSQLSSIKELKPAIVCIGDSTMAGTPSIGRNVSQWISFKLRREVLNKGVWGDSLSGVYTRLDADVIDYHPKFCVLLCGTNDIHNENSFANMIAQVALITEKLSDNSIIPVWCSILPRADFPLDMPAIRKFNYWLFDYCSKNNLAFADTYTSIINTDGSPQAHMLSGNDNLHPTCQATINMANMIMRVLPYEIALMNWRFAQLDNDEYFPNCDFWDDANADGIADGWTGIGSGSPVFTRAANQDTLEAETAAYGSWYQVITKPTTAARESAGITTTITNKFVALHKYRIEFDLDYEVSSLDDDDAITCYYGFFDVNNELITGVYSSFLGDANCAKLVTHPHKEFTVPAGYVTCQITFMMLTTSSAVLKISNINTREIFS